MKPMCTFVWSLTAILLLLSAEVPGQTPLGTEFTYQGQLKQAGVPVDGLTDFEFTLWDAESGGNQIGGLVTVRQVDVVNGLFTVQIDFGGSAFEGDARWLEITVTYPSGSGVPTTLSPRQAVTAAPYALYALSAAQGEGFWAANLDDIYNTNSGNVGIGTASPSHTLHVESSGAQAVFGENTASGGVGLHGLASDFEGGGQGVYGETYGTTGIGVFGIAAMTTGINCGVYGQSQSQTGRGVYGLANNAAGANYGVYGKTNSPDGWAGYFEGRGYFSGSVGIGTTNPAATLDVTNPGGQPAISGTSPWIGVYGIHNSTTGTFPGVWGETDSLASGAAGVRGKVTSTSPGSLSAGVYGINAGTGSDGVGVRGTHAGGGAGIYGTSEMGQAGHFEITNAANDEAAVYATTNGTGSAGEFVYDNAGSPGTGILATSNGPTGSAAVSGFATGAAHAVTGTTTGTGRAGLFQIVNASSDTTALYCSTTGTGLAFQANGTARVKVLEIEGADVAERFPVSEEVKPGMVVAIDPEHPGQLCLARGAYNCRVAGVVSGAGDLPVGAVLGLLAGHENATPIALTGRVYVWADASNGPIKPGDLLTTSDTPGHAMKATDRARSYGATIGKAMTGLDSGRGLVLVLVNVQ
jgi:hypothetical protein